MIAFIHSNTVQQAEQRARQLGVKMADYQLSLVIANEVNDALEILQQHGLPLPDHVKIDNQPFVIWATQLGINSHDTPAAFAPSRKTSETYLFFNPTCPHWADPAKDAAQQWQAQYWSTDHRHHVIWHEMGHLLHYVNNPTQYPVLISQLLTASEQTIAGKVSRRATESVLEFIAETFVALLTRRSLDPDVLQLYQRLGGQVP